MRVADSSGEAVDPKTRLEVIRQQESLIREEAAEKQKEVRVTVPATPDNLSLNRKRTWRLLLS